MLEDVSFALMPSRNHMLPKDGKAARPKYHVYFEITETEEAEYYAALKRAVRKKYPFFDRNALDAATFIFGSDAGEIVWHEGWDGVFVYVKQTQEYVEKLCSIIEKCGLVKYDVEASVGEDAGKKYYRVRKSWADAGSQEGAFTVLDNAKKCADGKPGYAVFDWNGEQVYPQRAETGGMMDGDCPFLVKVSISDLNIRKGSGTNTAKTGKITGKGIFTITEVRQGRGSEKGWGRLKSGAGWIALDFCGRYKRI